MKAVVFHDTGDVRLEQVGDPEIQDPTDAIVRLTASAICGTDLHMIRGTMPGMQEGQVLGHEGVGVVEEVGDDVRNLSVGDRVVIPSTIGCGSCSYCRSGYYAQCDTANPGGHLAGTAFFGGPEAAGGFDGLQAEYARIPFANVGPVKLPDGVSDDQAILISDIYPTGYFGADLAEIKEGDTVAVFGVGPVGQFAILSAFQMGAGRVLAVDRLPDRLDMARGLGAETINFEEEPPVEALRRLTGGIGPDRVIDAVGVDAEPAEAGPAAEATAEEKDTFHREIEEASAEEHPPPSGEGARGNGAFRPGSAPSQALRWGVEAVAKAGTLSIIGVYPQGMQHFPIGQAMQKNLSLNMGNCNHRRYMPELISKVAAGAVAPTEIVTQDEPIKAGIEAYEEFDKRQPGWIKVELEPGSL
jgi:threonine dehydrogenase-like Zn-dependent dehydrogenase